LLIKPRFSRQKCGKGVGREALAVALNTLNSCKKMKKFPIISPCGERDEKCLASDKKSDEIDCGG